MHTKPNLTDTTITLEKSMDNDALSGWMFKINAPKCIEDTLIRELWNIIHVAREHVLSMILSQGTIKFVFTMRLVLSLDKFDFFLVRCNAYE